jgi:hypothetical protein
MEKKEKKLVLIFDPTVGAYREVPIELAKQFIESAENAKKIIKKIEKDEKQD